MFPMLSSLPLASAAQGVAGWQIGPVPVEFILFGLTLVAVAIFHHYTMQVALTGLAVIAAYKIGITGFPIVQHLFGNGEESGEWVILLNLFALLTGFALLADHFEKSHVPSRLPALLPNDWKGGFVLLICVMVISSFLDNIAAALIGASVAGVVYKHKVHIGYLAAIVAASNAGGAGSVVGDTTTTMIWIAGGSPIDVFHAFVGSFAAVATFGVIAARQQQAYQPILKDDAESRPIDWGRLGVVALILALAIVANASVNIVEAFKPYASVFPWIGAAVWVAVLIGAAFRKTSWGLMPDAVKGSVFLLSLVTCASLMPVKALPDASWQMTLGLGFVSAVFDNIPLTALAIKMDHYDWGVLAYAVGFGGSMIWFGSSAGVAVSNVYPQAKSAANWLKLGWHVTLAYVVGFAAMMLTMGWNPHPLVRVAAPEAAIVAPATPGAQAPQAAPAPVPVAPTAP